MQALRQSIPEADGEPEWEVARLFPPRGKWSEEDYFALPDNRGVELVDGRLEFLPTPTETHQLILAFIYEALVGFVRPRGLGLVLFAGIPVRVSKDQLRQPDVVFMRREHASRRSNRSWDGADLAVEIISPSPSDRRRDEITKREEYAAAGILEYWLVDPDVREIRILVLSGETYRIHGVFDAATEASSVVLPGFSIAVDDMFNAAASAGGGDGSTV